MIDFPGIGGKRWRWRAIAHSQKVVAKRQSNGGFSGPTYEFWCKLGARPTLGIVAAKNELRRRPRRSRGTRSQQNVKILRHFREFVKKN